MQAVILADRRGGELAPLNNITCPAMVSVVDRPVLQQTVEDLAVAGVDEMLIVVSDDADRIEEHFARGQMWGVNIRYLLSRGEEAPDQLLRRFASLLRPPFILVRGDVLRSPVCREFLTAADRTAPVVSATIHDRNAGLCLVRGWPAKIDCVSWPLGGTHGSPESTVELGGAFLAPLDSPRNLHWAALALLQSSSIDTVTAGRYVDDMTRIGRSSRFNPVCRKSGFVIVGDNVSVHETVKITGPSVIGSNCHLDKGVEVNNSIVMPGTYVGKNLTVENAIVAGNMLIRVDRDTEVPILDTSLLSDVEEEVSGMLRRWSDSTLATVLLLVSSPLWPIAAILSVLRSPRSPMFNCLLFGNRLVLHGEGPQRKVVTARKFATRVPLLRNLPMLWLVVKGDLLLFGSSPPTPDSAGAQGIDCARRGRAFRCGLLGPAQLLPRAAPEEEIQIAELEFVAGTGLRSFVARAARATSLLFRRQAWLPVKDGLSGT